MNERRPHLGLLGIRSPKELRVLKRGNYSLSATATRAELNRKHPRGKDESIRHGSLFYRKALFEK